MKCLECGSKIIDEMNYCEHCGKSTVEVKINKVKEKMVQILESERKDKKWYSLGIVIWIIFLFAISLPFWIGSVI